MHNVLFWAPVQSTTVTHSYSHHTHTALIVIICLFVFLFFFYPTNQQLVCTSYGPHGVKCAKTYLHSNSTSRVGQKGCVYVCVWMDGFDGGTAEGGTLQTLGRDLLMVSLPAYSVGLLAALR